MARKVRSFIYFSSDKLNCNHERFPVIFAARQYFTYRKVLKTLTLKRMMARRHRTGKFARYQ